MSLPGQLLLIGLDAADRDLVHRLAAEGELPVLHDLMSRGRAGTLAGPAGLFAGGVWPTFYTGHDVGRHGLYHNKLWRQERMRVEIAQADWFPEPPFWERLGGSGLRMAILDVPMTVASAKPLDGVYLAGWGTHDVITRGSWPPSLWGDLARKHGKPKMPAELFGPQSGATLTRLVKELREATAQMGEIGASLLERERWDLFAIVFGATHRGGHYLWDLSQIDAATLPADTRRELERGLIAIYRAADQALGKILERAAADARILAFAVHGMGPNTTWADRCTEILARIQTGGRGEVAKSGLLYSIKRRLPWPLVRAITTRLPAGVQAALVTLWSRRMFDWSTTRAFPLPMDHAGYLRINLRGREPAGIVTPGAEYEALCDELAEGFSSFRDLATGRPIARRVHRLRDLAADDAAARDRLPDLVVEWGDVSAVQSPGLTSPRFGELRWSPPGRLPSGRAGNHRSHGWFVAAGPGIGAGAVERPYDIRDLVPTVRRWLGLPPDPELPGRPIDEVSG